MARRPLTLWLPGARPNSPNRRQGEHWSAQSRWKRKQAELVCAYAQSLLGPGPRKKPIAHVQSLCLINRYHRNPHDWDNFAAGCKGYIDGLVRSGIIKDDSPKVIDEFVMRQNKVDSKGEEGIEFQVWSAI